jgi:DNA-binding IclR family transcriptional regulator
MPPDDLNTYFRSQKLAKIGPASLTKSELAKQIEEVRRDEVAQVFEEYTPGIVGLAVPVKDPNGRLAGALNVAMPTVRYRPELRPVIIDALRQAARHLERRLSE